MVLAVGAVMAAQAVAAQAAPAGVAEFMPYRAAYTLALKHARSGSGIADVRGAMMVEAERGCEGWTTTQRVRMTFVFNERQSMESDTSYTSWESFDGLNYHFSSRTLRNGDVEEELRGVAVLDGEDGSGEARFSRPSGRSMPLPEGTLFPTAHLGALLEAARQEEAFAARTVFDGASLDGPYLASAALSHQLRSESTGVLQSPLTEGLARFVQIAYFPVDSADSAPRYEIGANVYESGAAGSMLLNYGDFSVDARLERLDPLEKPEC